MFSIPVPCGLAHSQIEIETLIAHDQPYLCLSFDCGNSLTETDSEQDRVNGIESYVLPAIAVDRGQVCILGKAIKSGQFCIATVPSLREIESLAIGQLERKVR